MIELRDGRPYAGPPGEPPGVRGVTETLLLRGGEPVFFPEHIARFRAGCALFGLARPPGPAELAAGIAELGRQGGLREGAVRWSAWKAADGTESWSLRLEAPRPHVVAPLWRVSISPRRLPGPGPVTAAKHLGRDVWREALAAGRAQGDHEVLLADGAGRLVEGAISNVFLVQGGEVRTPALAAGPLPGIVRAKVLDLARELGLPVREEDCSLDETRVAGEVFLTNSLVGPRPAGWLDGRPLSAPGPVTRRLQDAWRQRYGWI